MQQELNIRWIDINQITCNQIIWSQNRMSNTYTRSNWMQIMYRHSTNRSVYLVQSMCLRTLLIDQAQHALCLHEISHNLLSIWIAAIPVHFRLHNLFSILSLYPYATRIELCLQDHCLSYRPRPHPANTHITHQVSIDIDPGHCSRGHATLRNHAQLRCSSHILKCKRTKRTYRPKITSRLWSPLNAQSLVIERVQREHSFLNWWKF